MFPVESNFEINILFTRLYGGNLNDEGRCIIIDNNDHIIAAGSHQENKWIIYDDHFFDCQKFISYSYNIQLVKLKTDVLTPLQCKSSSGSYAFCENDSIVLTAPSGYSYQWNNGGTSQKINIETTGAFQVTIIDTAGNFEVLPYFNAYKYSFPTQPHFPDLIFKQCSGNFDLCLEVPYSDTIYDRNFRWFLSGVYSSAFAIEWDISGLPEGTYYNVSTNLCGSDTSGNYVLQNNSPIVNLGNDTILCSNHSIALDAGSGLFNYQWQDGNNLQTYLATSNISDTIIYFVKKTDLSGCSSSDTIQIIFEICSRINSSDQMELISVFPNPTKNNLFIHTNSSELIESIFIYNYIGQIEEVEYSQIRVNNYFELATNSYIPGVYILKVVTQNGNFITRFIKN